MRLRHLSPSQTPQKQICGERCRFRNGGNPLGFALLLQIHAEPWVREEAAHEKVRCRTHPLGLPSLCGILIEVAFSNVDCRTSSVALNARLFTISVLLAAPDAA